MIDLGNRKISVDDEDDDESFGCGRARKYRSGLRKRRG